MWRIGVILLIAVVAAENNSANIQDGLLQRLKRSPYNQQCFDYPPPPRPYWPPPPPPPPAFWPPPPPPNWPPPPRHHHHWEGSDNAGGGYGASAQAEAQATSQTQVEPSVPAKLQATGGQGPQGCDSCGGDGKNSAVSNAQSNTGDAVAVAIARARAN